jgi:hypothetical protein
MSRLGLGGIIIGGCIGGRGGRWRWTNGGLVGRARGGNADRHGEDGEGEAQGRVIEEGVTRKEKRRVTQSAYSAMGRTLG